MTDDWDALNVLARNFWWSWDAEASRLFRQLDPDVWDASEHKPVAVLDTLGPQETARRIGHLGLQDVTRRVLERFSDYLTAKDPSAGKLDVLPAEGPAAYFCAEFGIHESLHTYAGGLGILAGDHCKSASDLGLPLVAIGLLYREGYFTQLIESEGQQAYYRRDDFERMGLRPVCDESGRFHTLSVPMPDGEVRFCMWQTEIGRVSLYLLDANISPNRAEDRQLTLRLYGGHGDTRIRQEILLGVGGLRALRFLGIAPSVFHMNEGHTAFLVLELMRELVAEGMDFEAALAEVRARCVFTTHTPVPAGHDRFRPDDVERHLGWLRKALGVDERRFLSLGRVNPDDDSETFCMTVLGLKGSRDANGVSELHGKVTRAMWQDMWPERAPHEVPIAHITNGVHHLSWIAPEMADLLDSQLGPDWRARPWDPAVWNGLQNVPDSLLWAIHLLLKQRLLVYAWRHVMARRLRAHARGHLAVEPMYDPDVLTIGFARRFATYKRGDLLFRDLERARLLLADPERPIRILFAGKAHPQDVGGAEVLLRVVEASRDPVLSGHVLFIQDYGIDVSRYLVQGVDLWLNTPRRPREASGTSGQKVPFNGGINISTLDGWWAEGFDGRNGWCIGSDHQFASEWEQDDYDYEVLFQVLSHEIAPIYYERDPDGLPWRWVALMKESMRSVAPRFNSHRMVRDYAHSMYWPSV